MINFILIFYCIIIALASIFGGWIPTRFVMSHVRIQMIISFVAGVMLGVAVLHLLPHAISVLPGMSYALWATLVGILFMFFMNRFFHFHQHDFSGGEATTDSNPDHEHEHKHCDHEHHHHHRDTSWVGLSFGLAVHTLIDGIALAAAVQSESVIGFSFSGFSIFVAIVLHKPLDALSIVSLMKAKGWSEARQITVNIIFGLMCPLGAILFSIGLIQASTGQEWILGITLAFSAGVFLCISLGDLLPEVHFHSHDRLKLSIALLCGILLAVAIELLPGHNHELNRNNTNDDNRQKTESSTNKE